MARTNTANHAFSKAGDSSADQFNFTLDHTNLLDRLDAALAGLASYAAGSNYVNANANNAGKILSAVGGSYRGRVLGVTAADDAALIFQDNAGGTGADKFALGYDDSADVLALSAGATLGSGLLLNTSNQGAFTSLMQVRGGSTTRAQNHGLISEKSSIAAAGTAIFEISNLARAYIVLDVSKTTNGALQWIGDVVVAYNGTTAGGSTSIRVIHNGSSAGFLVAVTDFAITFPSTVIRVTYTNNGTDATNIIVYAWGPHFSQAYPSISVT